MADEDSEFVADRLNGEPPIVLGLTNSELGMILKVGAVTILPTCTVIGFLFGAFTIGLAVAALLMMGSVPICGKLLQAVKRDRPDYFYQHKIALRAKPNSDSKTYITYTGDWELGRTEEDD